MTTRILFVSPIMFRILYFYALPLRPFADFVNQNILTPEFKEVVA